MQKTEVYSWRLSPRLKNELAEKARAERKSLAELLEEIAESWLRQAGARDGDEVERQQRLHEAALPFVGAIDGGQPDRAETASSPGQSAGKVGRLGLSSFGSRGRSAHHQQ